MIGVSFAPRSLADLAQRHGGELRNGARGIVRRLVPVKQASAGDLTVLLHPRYIGDAIAAMARGALFLIDEALAARSNIGSLPGWFHRYAAWAMAEVLDVSDAPADEPVMGSDCVIGRDVHLLARVRMGSRVTIASGAVIGAPGFGFATGPDGVPRAIPQLGGVIIEDDVHIGPLSTIAAGTLGPTVIRRGAKLDAQVHVGHNCEIGEGTIVAAQSGLAGSVIVGNRVLIGGQVGIADHLTVGDGARIAAKSGVIGDVPAGATVAGYPAVDRHRWLRALAELYRFARGSRAIQPSLSAGQTSTTSPPFDPGSSVAPGTSSSTSTDHDRPTPIPPSARMRSLISRTQETENE